MKKGKYIITLLSPILFDEGIKHSDLRRDAKSAGFFHLKRDIKSEGGFDVICYGESTSMDLKSNPAKDAKIIKDFLLN